MSRLRKLSPRYEGEGVWRSTPRRFFNDQSELHSAAEAGVGGTHLTVAYGNGAWQMPAASGESPTSLPLTPSSTTSNSISSASLHHRQRSRGEALDGHSLSTLLKSAGDYASDGIHDEMISPRSAAYERLETGRGAGNVRQGMLRNLGWKKIALGITCFIGVVWVFQRNGNGKEASPAGTGMDGGQGGKFVT